MIRKVGQASSPVYSPSSPPEVSRSSPETEIGTRALRELNESREEVHFKKVVRVEGRDAESPVLSFPASGDLEGKKALAKRFQIGDIIFTKQRAGHFKFTPLQVAGAGILFVQKTINWIYSVLDKEGYYRMTHAGIVVGIDEEHGKVLIAEAMPKGKKNELQICDLFAEYRLESDSPWEYEILRMNPEHGEALPKLAAEIAQSLSSRELLSGHRKVQSNKGDHAYSALKGLVSLFSQGKERYGSRGHLKRIFKKIADEELRGKQGREIATAGKRHRAFFCSFFTAHAFQQAELSMRMKEIKKMAGVREGLRAIRKMPEGRQRTKAIQKWANQMAKQHKKMGADAILQHIKHFQLDPKHTSPQDLIRFMRREDRFQKAFRIVPPI